MIVLSALIIRVSTPPTYDTKVFWAKFTSKSSMEATK